MKKSQILRGLMFGMLVTLLGCSHGLVKRSDLQPTGDGSHVEVLVGGEISDNAPAVDEPYAEIPDTDHVLVNNWIKYFQGRGRKHMRVYLEKSSRYLPMMKQKLKEEGLPEDLIYIVIVESGFSATAHSRANAVGYWQFIRETGRRYGLKVDGYVDERRDPVFSTEAAAQYFKSLYSLFGDWYLAMAAYNTGENRVKRAVMQSGTRDFFALVKKRKLHKETQQYVPKFLAARRIAKNPAAYGFDDISYQPVLQYDKISLAKPVSMSKLATELQVSETELRRLNPGFRSDYVPVYKESQEFRLPVGYMKVASNAIDNSFSQPPARPPTIDYYYRVRRGDTLSEIAMRHRTTVGTLKRMNGLRNRSFIRVGQRLRVPERFKNSKMADSKPPDEAKRSQPQSRSYASLKNKKYHVVRRGENLSVIAQKYRTTVSQIKRLNSLGRRSLIRVGQRLVVEGSPQSRVSKKVHVVRRGETLIEIANQYEISMYKLARANAIKNRSVLYAGTKLVIPKN